MFNDLFVPIMALMGGLGFAAQLMLSNKNVSKAVKFLPVYPCVIGMTICTVVFYWNPTGNELGYDPASFVVFLALLCVLVFSELAWVVHWIMERMEEKKFMRENTDD